MKELPRGRNPLLLLPGKSKGRKDCYTFNLSEAKICSSEEAYQISTMITKRSRVGRTWYPLRIK